MNNLHLSPEAQKDLLDIREHISEDLENPKAALSIVGKIMDAIRSLQYYAMMGTPLSAIADVDSTYRYLVCGNYMVFYRVNQTEVYVDRILYGRRDYLRILTDNPNIS